MVGNGRHEHAMQRRDQSALLGMQRLVVVDGTDGRLSHASLSDIQTGLELGGNVRKGEHGTKVYFVKQHQLHDKGSDDNSAMRLVPMMREYAVFNVDQCEKSCRYRVAARDGRIGLGDSKRRCCR
jgi:antirestriction protein ArdC